MKIGILTFHYAHNYGAVMQAYALKTVLIKLGHDVKVLNYQNPGIKANYIRDNKFQERNKQLAWERQYDKFEEFINFYIIEDERMLSFDELSHIKLDALICGSDQIWNSGLTGGLDDAYFLNFKTSARKISYAPSKIKSWIKEEEKSYWKFTLTDFDFLSVRESALAAELTTLISKDVISVLDPVFLLDADEYDSVCEKKHVEKGYVFVYFLLEDNNLNECAQQIAHEKDLRIIEMHYFAVKENGNIQIADCGPMEFLNLIKNAETVITNSFHGVAFSVLYKKQFWAVYDADMRKDDLLLRLGLLSRKIGNASEIFSERKIDYTESDKLLRKEKETSIKFLINALLN